MKIPQVDNFGEKQTSGMDSTFIGLKPGFQIERNVESSLLDFALKKNATVSKRLVESEIVRAIEPVALMVNMLSKVRILETGRCFVRSVTSRKNQESITIQLPEVEWLEGFLDFCPLMSFKVYAKQALLLTNRAGKVMPQSPNDLEHFFIKHSHEVLKSQDSHMAGAYYIYRFAYTDKYDNDFYIQLAKSGIDLDLGLGILQSGDFDATDFDMIKNSPRSQVQSIILASSKD